LLFNTGYLPAAWKPVVFSWQMLLITIGIIFLFSHDKRIPGIILTLLGLLLLFPILKIDSLACLKHNGWAIGLILGGLLLLFRLFGKRSHCCGMDGHRRLIRRRLAIDRSYRWSYNPVPPNEPGYVEMSCVFGGGNKKITSQNFKGGAIDCVFGGAEIDFMDAQLADGVHTLEISAVFGGVTLYIPAHWNVELRQNPVFGRFEDKRPRPTFEVNENRTLIINASAVFGGGEIKSRN
jgi:predicted membrane protein